MGMEYDSLESANCEEARKAYPRPSSLAETLS